MSSRVLQEWSRKGTGERLTHGLTEESEVKALTFLLGVYAWIGINFVLGRFDHEDGK